MSKEEKRVQMFAMISDWQQSGLSKKRYCAENGINEATFYYWFSRSKENDTASGGFIVIDKTGRKSAVEVIYPSLPCTSGCSSARSANVSKVTLTRLNSPLKQHL